MMPNSFGERLRWWRKRRTLSQLDLACTAGTSQDVTVQEIRIECFFPADADTSRLFREWAADAPP